VHETLLLVQTCATKRDSVNKMKTNEILTVIFGTKDELHKTHEKNKKFNDMS
jgi:hypothetical protein